MHAEGVKDHTGQRDPENKIRELSLHLFFNNSTLSAVKSHRHVHEQDRLGRKHLHKIFHTVPLFPNTHSPKKGCAGNSVSAACTALCCPLGIKIIRLRYSSEPLL